MSECINEPDLAIIDTSGLVCPLPILTVKKRIKSFVGGQIFHVITTDSSSAADFPAFCEMVGLEILESRSHDGRYILLMRKA
jgi:tRNA 2-thiouridine synthesizing protein A